MYSGGKVIADGLDGMASTGVNEGGNGGGGAGGSIIILASYFFGGGKLSANGGDGFSSSSSAASNAALAAKTYGGGGGGGRLHIKWKLGQSVFASTNNQDWTENFTGIFRLLVDIPTGIMVIWQLQSVLLDRIYTCTATTVVRHSASHALAVNTTTAKTP